MRVALVGAAGRMGREILEIAATDPDVTIGAAIVGDDELGVVLRAEEVVCASEAEWVIAKNDVVIDFSSPAGLENALTIAVSRRRPFVSGTTGLGPAQIKALDDAATEIPVLWAPNFSVGVNVIEHLVELASRALEGFDVEVFEAHHRRKVDSPSGTARFLGEAAARGREVVLDDVAEWGRHGVSEPRSSAEIGFQVLRAGSIVGDHTVFFCGAGERVEITHRAEERAIFARGAVRAAKWIVGQPPGRYSMKDVLFGQV